MKKTAEYVLFTAVLIVLAAGCASVDILGGPVVPQGLEDGIYQGQAKNGPVKVKVNVTIQGQTITAIELVEHRTWKGEPAENVIPQRIIAEQSTRVDAVSGATLSSTAIMNAVENAVQKAY